MKNLRLRLHILFFYFLPLLRGFPFASVNAVEPVGLEPVGFVAVFFISLFFAKADGKQKHISFVSRTAPLFPEGVLAGDSCSKQNCRNDGISMRRHKHLLVGVSGIKDAGWGLYTKNALSKDDFIQEYTGELISQEEADRRGRVYDKVCFPSDDDAAKNNKIVNLTLLTLLPPLSFPFFFK